MATFKTGFVLTPSDKLLRCITAAPNDTLVGVRTDNYLCSKQGTGGVWTSYSFATGDASIIIRSITRHTDGTYYAVAADNGLYTRTMLAGGTWAGPYTTQQKTISTANDGILIGVTDGGLATTTNAYNGPWVAVPNSGGMMSVIQLSDGMVLGIGKDNLLYSWDTLVGSWTKVSDKLIPIISMVEFKGKLMAVGTDNKLYSAELVMSPSSSLIPVPLYYSQKLKFLSESFTEVGNDIVVKGTYEVQFSDMEVRIDSNYLALVDVEIPATVSADWKVTPKRVTRVIGTVTPGGVSSRQISYELLIGKDELLHSLHSTRAFNDVSIVLSMKLRLVPTNQGSEVTTAEPVVLFGTAPIPDAAATPPYDTTDDLRGTITASGDNGVAEGKEKAFDNSTGSKWLDFKTQGSWIQYSYVAGLSGGLTAYSLTSANDSPERDPAAFQLLGSNDGGATWTVVDSRTGVTFSQRSQKLTFTINGKPIYKAYRLNIAQVLNPTAANCMQLAEIELIGIKVASPA